MARDYISGKISLPEGPIPGVGGLDQLQMADTQNFTFGDNEQLIFGTDADAYMKWDGSALQLVSALGTITGQKQGLNITVTGTLSSGEGLIGLQVNATPSGTAGRIALGEFVSFAMSVQAVNGYVGCSELEMHLSGSYNVCSNAVLVLDYWNDVAGSPQSIQAYVFLQDYGAVACQNLLYFLSKNRASASNAVILSQRGSVAGGTIDTMVRCVDSDGTPFWLLAATGGPAGQPDLKVMGSATGNYLEWDASADRLNVVVAGRTVTGAERALNVSLIGTVSSGGGLIAGGFAVAPVGTAASYVIGLFVSATQASKVVNGYICAAEFELASTAANASDNSILILNSIRNHTGSPPACDPYLTLREYGTTYADVFVRIFGDTGQGAVNAVNAARLVSQAKAAHEADCDVVIRCMVGSTPVWLLASTVPPS